MKIWQIYTRPDSDIQFAIIAVNPDSEFYTMARVGEWIPFKVSKFELLSGKWVKQ